jgi:hypothetical protein
MLTSTKSEIPARQIRAPQANFRAPGPDATATALDRTLADGPYIIGLLIVILAGCAARFYQRDHTSIWMNEVYSYFLSTQSLRERPIQQDR